MDDASYLKTVDQVRVNICRHESSNDLEAGEPSLVHDQGSTISRYWYKVLLTGYL